MASDKLLRAHHRAWDLTDKLRAAEAVGVKGATREAYTQSHEQKYSKVAELRDAAAAAHRKVNDIAHREGSTLPNDALLAHGTTALKLGSGQAAPQKTPTERVAERPTKPTLNAANLSPEMKQKLASVQQTRTTTAAAPPTRAQGLAAFAQRSAPAAGHAATPRALQRGAKGGMFYVSKDGSKVYVK